MIFHENLIFRCGNAHTLHSVMNNVFVSKVGTFLHFSRNSLCRSHVFYVTRKINYQPVPRPLSPPLKREKKKINKRLLLHLYYNPHFARDVTKRPILGWMERMRIKTALLIIHNPKPKKYL